jgi:hypothetical protein
MESPPALGFNSIVLKELTNNTGGKVNLGGLKRWFSPRGFPLSCIDRLGFRAAFELKQNKTKADG